MNAHTNIRFTTDIAVKQGSVVALAADGRTIKTVPLVASAIIPDETASLVFNPTDYLNLATIVTNQ